MSALMQAVWDRALDEGVPLSVHFDLTYRCNERCVHCYLDHDDHGEMTTAEVKHVLDQLAAAGTLFLIFSGGELLLRKDFFELVAYARQLGFDIKLKTNGLLIGERAAARIRELGVRQVQISVYSHRPDVHDGITKVPGSLDRTLAAIRFLKAQGLRVLIANVLMRQNVDDYPSVRALAAELGVECTIDPTITPKMDGDRSIVSLRVSAPQLLRVFTDKSLLGDSLCEPPEPAAELMDDAALQRRSHGVLHLTVWRRLPVRAVPVANRQRASAALRRDLVPLAANERGARDSRARSANLFDVQLHAFVYAVPRPRLYGRQHAWAVFG